MFDKVWKIIMLVLVIALVFVNIFTGTRRNSEIRKIDDKLGEIKKDIESIEVNIRYIELNTQAGE